jgi:dihydroflavonol-4-reductase
MRVLVTGGTGFVGSWLVKRLVQEGHDVRLLHRPQSSLAEVEGVEFESANGDVADLGSLLKATDGIDTVFHLAGLVAYKKSQRKLMNKVNIGGTENVITACDQRRVRKLVYMSSVVAIGASFTPTVLDETSPYEIGPLNLGYFETKRIAEERVMSAYRAGRVDPIILNPSTVYGPGDAKKGSRKIHIKVARGEFPFYPPGGASVVSIHDVIDAILTAWNKGRSAERYILSGENLLVRDLFAKIAHFAGQPAPQIPLPRPAIKGVGRLGDALESFGLKGPINSENAWVSTLYHWFDSTKAKTELGFSPRSADIAIEESVNWMRENGYLESESNS